MCRSERRVCQTFLYWCVLSNPKCYCITYLSMPKVATVSLRHSGQKRNSEVCAGLFLRLGAFSKKCSFSFFLAGWAEIAQGREQLHYQAKKNRTAPAPYGHPNLPAVPGQSRRAWNPSCSSWLPAIIATEKAKSLHEFQLLTQFQPPGTLGFLFVLFLFPLGW